MLASCFTDKLDQTVLTLLPTWHVAPLPSLESDAPQASDAVDPSACLPVCLSGAFAGPRSACGECQRAPACMRRLVQTKVETCSGSELDAECCKFALAPFHQPRGYITNVL